MFTRANKLIAIFGGNQTMIKTVTGTLFLQIVLGLRYLHKEKHIVHRDLTPNNIMLGENDKVTISKILNYLLLLLLFFQTDIPLILLLTFFVADFGLAKQKNPDASKMTSMVGTILYSWYVVAQELVVPKSIDANQG